MTSSKSANRSEFMAALATIFHGLLGRSIRLEGLLALHIENCKACSGYANNVEPIKYELDAVVNTVNQLIDVFDKEANK